MLDFPEIDCEDNECREGDPQVALKCTVRSDPPLTWAKWWYYSEFEKNETILPEQTDGRATFIKKQGVSANATIFKNLKFCQICFKNSAFLSMFYSVMMCFCFVMLCF